MPIFMQHTVCFDLVPWKREKKRPHATACLGMICLFCAHLRLTSRSLQLRISSPCSIMKLWPTVVACEKLPRAKFGSQRVFVSTHGEDFETVTSSTLTTGVAKGGHVPHSTCRPSPMHRGHPKQELGSLAVSCTPVAGKEIHVSDG